MPVPPFCLRACLHAPVLLPSEDSISENQRPAGHSASEKQVVPDQLCLKYRDSCLIGQVFLVFSSRVLKNPAFDSLACAILAPDVAVDWALAQIFPVAACLE